MTYKLLSVSSDTKTTKGEVKGYLTGILYLAPANTVEGLNLCPTAELAGCKSACLYTAGRGAFSNVQLARVRKTEWYRDNRQGFMQTLADDISRLVRQAKAKGLIPCVRLNGTSDIRWENEPVLGADNAMALFPEVQFYDYTKLSNRKGLPGNYHLTFSYSGTPGYQKLARQAIDNGLNIAVAFHGTMPETFLGLPVINGDETDLRFLDPRQVIVGLKAKGKAPKDNTGFVIRIMPQGVSA